MAESPQPSEPITPEVTFDEFRKIDIRVAKVIDASRVPNSAKLVKLILDIGGQRKQCIAGIGTAYTPEQLQDKLIAGCDEHEAKEFDGISFGGYASRRRRWSRDFSIDS